MNLDNMLPVRIQINWALPCSKSRPTGLYRQDQLALRAGARGQRNNAKAAKVSTSLLASPSSFFHAKELLLGDIRQVATVLATTET